MGAVEAIYQEYIRMRDSGIAVKAVLNLLRDRIDALDEAGKQTIARQLRGYEVGRTQDAAPAPIPALEVPAPAAPVSAPAVPAPAPALEVPAPAPAASLRPAAGLRRLTPEPRPAAAALVTIVQEAAAPAAQTASLEWITCPHCGKSSQRHEVLCYACGRLLYAAQTENETQALAETNDLSHSDDFFGDETVLILRARATSRAYEVRPQCSDHGIVIGRSTPGSAVIPDIDLADQNSDKLGVSRLHLTLRYDAQYHTISVFDMGSANGTYINGQRLHAHEVRVLRDADELRLGRLVLGVAFRHPA